MVFLEFLVFLEFMETSEVAGPGPNPREIEISFGADGPLACARPDPTIGVVARPVSPGGLGRSANVAHHRIATWAWPRFHNVLAPAATAESRLALAKFLPKP